MCFILIFTERVISLRVYDIGTHASFLEPPCVIAVYVSVCMFWRTSWALGCCGCVCLWHRTAEKEMVLGSILTQRSFIFPLSGLCILHWKQNKAPAGYINIVTGNSRVAAVLFSFPTIAERLRGRHSKAPWLSRWCLKGDLAIPELKMEIERKIRSPVVFGEKLRGIWQEEKAFPPWHPGCCALFLSLRKPSARWHAWYLHLSTFLLTFTWWAEHSRSLARRQEKECLSISLQSLT